jgi:hypothetical protein
MNGELFVWAAVTSGIVSHRPPAAGGRHAAVAGLQTHPKVNTILV